MTGLNRMDRDSCRFFLVGDRVNNDYTIKAYRFKVVLFGSTAAQFLLNATVDHHPTLNPSKTSELIARNLYVDNTISTFNSESEVVSFEDPAMTLMKEGDLNSRQRHSNKTYSNDFINVDKPVNVLGLNWHTKTEKSQSRLNCVTSVFCNGGH